MQSIKNKYSQYVNSIWKEYLNSLNTMINCDKKSDPQNIPSSHVFLNDLDWVEDLDNQFRKKSVENPSAFSKSNKTSWQIDDYFDAQSCKLSPDKILPENLVEKIYEILKSDTVPIWDDLTQQMDLFQEYLLYSNINLEKYLDTMRNRTETKINILILGGGPTGLYIANYFYYADLLKPKPNLLILDNRIKSEGLGLPYSRNRQYGIDLSLMNNFVTNFSCIDGIKRSISIRYLQNLLLIMVYGRKIPIYFTNIVSNEASLKQFVYDNKIDIVFDCTGNRLPMSFFDNIPKSLANTFFPSDILLQNDKYQIVFKKNEVEVIWNKHIKSRFYLSMEIYQDDGKYGHMPIVYHPLDYAHDIKFFGNFHNKCLKMKHDKQVETVKLFERVADLFLSKQVQFELLANDNRIFKFSIIEPKLHHKLIISRVIKQNNWETVIVGAGDTIFSSHFVVGAGLNRLLPFIDKLVWSCQFFGQK